MPPRHTLVASTMLALLLSGTGIGAAPAQADGSSGLYVNDAAALCSDTGPGTPTEPFCQIQPAADAVTAGETVYITPNTSLPYKPVTITSKGTADAPISFASTSAAVPVMVKSTTATPITFSGAQYVNTVGISAAAQGSSNAVAMTGASHISYSVGVLHTVHTLGSTTAPAPALTVDGSSTDIALTRLDFPYSSGTGVVSSPGAKNLTIADDWFDGEITGGVSLAGTSGIRLTGNTFATVCGDAISITGGSSGSVENNVAAAGGTTTCSDTANPYPEISVDSSSAPQITADYNAVNPESSGTDYSWAGSSYSTGHAFSAATGQGVHDLDQTGGTFSGIAAPTEHSALIDSADVNAPGEQSTDYYGKARVDDPLVGDTGAGSGSYDRGALEFQDPLAVTGLTSPGDIYVTAQQTFTAAVSNPWSDSLNGFSYDFDFGDGSTATSTTGSAAHTYAEPTNGTYDTASVVGYDAAGRNVGAAQSSFRVDPVPALSSRLGCSAFAPDHPDTARCDWSVSSFYPVTSHQINYGDGTAPVSPTGTDGTVTHKYAAPGTYTATDKVTDSHGRSTVVTSKFTVGTAFVATGPSRVLDTRSGLGAARHKVGPGGVLRLKISGVDSIPSSGVSAVTMNVTVTNPTTAGYVTAYADGAGRPTASNVNFKASQTVANLVTVPVGKDGYVDLFNASGYTDLIADVQGYDTVTDAPASVTDETMTYLATAPTPTRVLDTRSGLGGHKGRLGPGSVTTVTLPGAGSDATVGAVLNLTVTGGSSNGWISVYCGSGRPPATSNLNFLAGQTKSNLATTVVCTGGKVDIYNSSGYTDLIVDLQGLSNNVASTHDSVTLGDPYVPSSPTRILDTRSGTGTAKAPIGAGGSVALKVAGVAGVPTTATAVLVNLTGVAPTSATYLTGFGSGSRPTASNLNLSAGETRSALALLPVDSNGYVHLYNASGKVNAVADLEGYFG